MICKIFPNVLYIKASKGEESPAAAATTGFSGLNFLNLFRIIDTSAASYPS